MCKLFQYQNNRNSLKENTQIDKKEPETEIKKRNKRKRKKNKRKKRILIFRIKR